LSEEPVEVVEKCSRLDSPALKLKDEGAKLFTQTFLEKKTVSGTVS
jgi:hypothetical protein